MAELNYKGVLNGLTISIQKVVDDFIEENDLRVGIPYRISTHDGKYVDGFFKSCHASIYRPTGKLDVWVCFYKIKKDFSPSRVETGCHMSNIRDVMEFPF